MQSFDRLRMKVLVDEDRLEDQDAIALGRAWLGPHLVFPRCQKRVGARKGLWIPAAARIAMAPPGPHMSMKMAIFMAMTGGMKRPWSARVLLRLSEQLRGVIVQVGWA